MENSIAKLKVKNTIKCESDGSLTQTEYPNITGMNADIKIQTLSYEGAAFPPPAQWLVGATWTNKFKIKMNIKMGARETNANGTMTIVSKIAAEESVKVPAGTFSALKVVQTIQQDLTMSVGGNSVPMKNTIATTNWYARGVGLVKSVASTITTQLVKFTKP